MAITFLNHDKHKIYCPFIYPHILKGHLGSFSGEEMQPSQSKNGIASCPVKAGWDY